MPGTLADCTAAIDCAASVQPTGFRVPPTAEPTLADALANFNDLV